MKNTGGNMLFYLFAAFLFFYWIPREERKIKARTMVVMMDSLGRKVAIIDDNGDGIADIAVGEFPAVKRSTTEVEQKYFTKHKKQKPH